MADTIGLVSGTTSLWCYRHSPVSKLIADVSDVFLG